MSSFRMTTLAILAIGFGAIGAISPASSEQMMWWELGVTPSYGYGDDYPQVPREAREARTRWIRHFQRSAR
jgi:hypothetical protein